LGGQQPLTEIERILAGHAVQSASRLALPQAALVPRHTLP
jgi:hypothetical protein